MRLLFLLLLACACVGPASAQRSTGICNYRDGRGWVPCVSGPPPRSQPPPPDPAVLEAQRKAREAAAANEKGLAAMAREDWTAAEAFFSQALELAPDNHTYSYNLSEARRHLQAIEDKKARDREQQQKFERDKADVLNNLKTVTADGTGASGNGELQIKTVTADDRPKPRPMPERPLQESQYLYTLQMRQLEPLNDGGKPIESTPQTEHLHGLVGGTSWTYGFRRPKTSCPAECQATMKAAMDKQLSLYCSSQSNPKQCMSDGLPFTPDDYDFVTSMGSYHSFAEDMALRVVFDSATFGRFTAEHKEVFATLLDRQFDQLDCHSNGAMLCLAALESGRTKATEVRLFGPQINPAAAEKWKALAAKGIKVTIYVNNGDPVPALSWQQPVPQTVGAKIATALWVSSPRQAISFVAKAAVNTYEDSKTQWVDRELKKYGFNVARLQCSERMNTGCHAMKAYESSTKGGAPKW